MAIIHVLGSSISFYVFLLIFPLTSSISESEALLKLKESFANATSLDSWKPGTQPCAKNQRWIGILCENGVVWGLRLGNSGLSGKIDVDALVSLSGLRSLSFVGNAFSGPIPEFHRMNNLRGLYLSRNQFSGEILSDYFTKLAGLRKIWLSENRFSGPIPSSLAGLSHLMELHLEDNQFSGTIPLLEQASLISVNFSNNNLEGEVPSGMSKFGADSFKGNPGLCGGNLSKACEGPMKQYNSHDQEKFMWVLAASAILFLLMVVGIYVLKKRQENDGLIVDESPSLSASPSAGKKDIDSGQAGLGSGQQNSSGRKGSGKYGKGVGDIVMINYEKGEFGLHDLMKAVAEVLGNGALGSSYKAVMATGLIVVVKRIKEMNKMGRDQFDLEMKRLGSLEHKNVLTPLAYHYRKEEKLLVYEYQPKGSLFFLLHGDRGLANAELNWPVRLKIIQGIARGLFYLHTELTSHDLPHGHLKSSNILLTPENEPVLTDYGFFSLISSSQVAQSLTAYKSPEAIFHQTISPKCDVFCLGIVVLEILTGKIPSQYGEGGTDIVQWVRSAIAEGKEAELFDPSIVKIKNSNSEMEQLLHISVACTEMDPDQRLDIREAVRRIEGICVEE
ncbi:Serine/threonine protein kinase [Handroanthus impetiginosus]|uniref:Serine/threonine protein kinase n=1 Tax=Handroanthus impetiginosus TaxID=429701 RepID=A0A2G9GTY2_9LAMI|nr:Serine/threonine protein kinase [Handroanthus impetiginosus]